MNLQLVLLHSFLFIDFNFLRLDIMIVFIEWSKINSSNSWRTLGLLDDLKKFPDCELVDNRRNRKKTLNN